MIIGMNMQRYASVLNISRPVTKAIKPITVKDMMRDSRKRVKSWTRELKIFGVFILYMMIKISRIRMNTMQMMQTVVSLS